MNLQSTQWGSVQNLLSYYRAHSGTWPHRNFFLSAWKKGFKSFLPHLLLSISVHQHWEKLFTASCSAPRLARSRSPPPLLICLDTNAKEQDWSLPSSSAHSAVSLGNWCSYQLQPFIPDNACLSGFCFCYFLFLPLPHSAAWHLSCPGYHSVYAEPWAISPAEFLSLGSALSVNCCYSAPCHEQQLLWFFSGHNAVWHLPCKLIIYQVLPSQKIFTFEESSPASFIQWKWHLQGLGLALVHVREFGLAL